MVHQYQLMQALGVVHVLVAMYCSVWFVDLVTPSLQNDLFWPGFGPSTAQTYLLDVYRRHLTTSASAASSLDLLDAREGILKVYGTPTTVGSVQSTYARSLALGAYTSVEDAVVGFRSLDPSYAFSLVTLYCWADFDRRWALAHTAARQARCAAFMHANGAVYLESVLRNVAWAPWAALYGASFDAAVGDGIRASAGGEAWLASLENAFTSTDDEVAYWRSKHISRYELQWSNMDEIGIHESIGVVNMLGWAQALTTAAIAYAPRSSMWTSFALNWAFFDDLWAAAITNSSLLRGASDYIGDATIESLLFVYPYTPASLVLHNELGPFQSVDLFLIPPPTALVNAVTSFDALVARALQTNRSLLDAYRAVPVPLLDPIPVAWSPSTTTLRFLGGSPLCAYGLGTPFVQPSFSFDDTCGAEVPSRLALTVPPTVFAAAILASNEEDVAICRPCSMATTTLCTVAAHAASNVGIAVLTETVATTDFYSRVQAATDAVALLQVEIIQFAIDTNGATSVSRNYLLDRDWTFFGWVMLHEWALGFREVVSFQGDVRALTLLSERVEPQPFAASALEVPTPTATYLHYVVLATTSWLLFVTLLTLLYFACSDEHTNVLALRHLYRVAGPVWLGRPILLLRAAAATTVLSTACIRFESQPLGRFEFAPRDLWTVIVLAGEAAWGTIVVSDVLLVLPSAPTWSGPLSTGLVWTAIVLFEVLSPIRMTATLHRECSRVNVNAQLSCSGGNVVIGSATRAWLIAAITVGTVVTCNGLARVVSNHRSRVIAQPPVDVAWPLAAAAAALLAPVGDIWSIDAVTACTSGLVRLRLGTTHIVFDIKLWVVFVAPSDVGPPLPVVCPPHVDLNALSPVVVKRGSLLRSKLMVIVGLVYVVGTAGSSLSYLRLSSVNLANDFWWATFNTTGTHTFIANWFNRNVQVTPALSQMRLDTMAFADMTSYASTSMPLVAFSPLYAHRVQYETGETLPLVIQGLRSLDACDAPWIATAYCWLDLDRHVEMAMTSARQARCAVKHPRNAAVYLEALLRNVQWDRFLSCWGPSFERGIAVDAVSLLPDGHRWLTSLPLSNDRSVPSEVDLWTKGYDLAFYLPQWQNYKDLGLTDVFSVENAFGLFYDLTLQSTRATSRLAAATSRKMYWSFASDLYAVNDNSSGLVGFSLLRSSPRFAFQNLSATAVYTQNGSVLQAPLSAAYVVFESCIGPFGSVDLYHIAPPQSLLTLQRDIGEALAIALTTPDSMSAAFPAQESYTTLVLLNSLSPVPLSLDRTLYRCAGGNLFCNDLAFNFNLTNGMSQFTGVHATCNTAFNEWIFVSVAQAVFAVLSSGLETDTIPMACAPEVIAPVECQASLRSVHAFTSTYLPSTFRDRAKTVERDVVSLGVGIMQYAQHVPTHALSLFFEPLFASLDMHYMSWALAHDWAVGIREALVVTGDVASLAILTAQSKPATFSASAIELPLNTATYVRGFCQYISVVLVVLAIVISFYTVSTMGSGEGWNLLEINRVGGMVWIGRPLLLVRSISALCILSTATLELVSRGDATILATSRSDVAAPIAFLTSVLAASELGWLVYIFNDVAMVITRQYTASYTIKAALLCMLLAILLSVLSPIAHSVTIDRVCVFVALDFTMQCHSGVVTIGSRTRLVTLSVIAVGVSTAMFALDRARCRLPLPLEKDSYLLSSGAKYLFEKEGWVVHGIYCLDYASAALSGLLVLRYRNVRYIFDIKTWRLLVLTDDEVARVIKDGANVLQHYQHTLPLIK
ncbi:hypothetical protein SDRG_09209 [Saprolegnia diclina VS20]|uniref:Uncharacterized protein n=1 Tax=Saprolegnia diclina (strain VS20) TaxID=1156394 RepID=T0QHP6_SAPDV|nr:hypothetical protein SDRG_09209 [Saprolegnia diclina VS20]EQC33225.1 hypothetical protein SDRG_09209 [Saprolegnia diclina VS20]|eukprot:XP_008613348.1 hypothetical protein SDRG_09209 [Saprolegnia diclina VS20]